MFFTMASIMVGAWHNPRRGRAIAVTACRFDIETLFHHALPFEAVWLGPFTGFSGLPEDDKMGDSK